MNFLPIEPTPSAIESLLANERTIEPVPEEVRMRAVGRARTELAHRLRIDASDSRRFFRLRKVTVAVAAAAGVMLVAFGAVAFRAVYRSNFMNGISPANTSAPEPRIPNRQVSATWLDDLPEVSPVVTTTTERSSKAKVAGRAKTENDSETYALELGLLQPAYHAVARHDFTSALAAIASHQRRFASGQLAEEREALRVKALLGLGRRAEAKQAAFAFGKRFPRSVLLQRIEGLLSASQ
jgi:hypothetical protein